MPKFILNKLVRDKLPAEYERMGETAVYRDLSPREFLDALLQKLVEEVAELTRADSSEKIADEIGDIRQLLEDIVIAHSIDPARVKAIQAEKLEKKGGFADARFVETLELADEDEWVAYYRKFPDIFTEIDG